jgi:hypothetical protein
MVYWDNPNPLYETGASLYIVLGVLLAGILHLYEWELCKGVERGGSIPQDFKYFYYNRFWGVVKILIVILPIIYAIIWNENSYIYCTDVEGEFFK